MAIAAAAALITTLPGSTQARDEHGPGIAPPHSHAYGKSLPEWLETYWRWYYTGADAADSKVGRVQLMPLPAGAYIRGSGTPADPALYRGQLEITLLAGTPFVLPEFAWVWERYDPTLTGGQPDDVLMPDAVALANAHPRLTFDGRTVLSDANKAAYFVPNTAFDPIVVYPAPTSYGSIAALSFQSVGVVGEPMSVGRHVIHLYETLIAPDGSAPSIPPGGIGLIDDNTWIVIVLPEDLGNHEIAPPNSETHGKTYGEWSAAWWTWAMELPVTGPIPHPFVDDPAFDVTEGQHGNVWFLATPFGTVNRTCTIPAGKALFIGTLNAEASDLEGYGATEAEQRASAQWQADHIVPSSLSATVDGVDVENITSYRAQSPQFSFTAPTPWIFGATGGDGLAVADGYYLMVAPPSVGSHRIHYKGTIHFGAGELGPGAPATDYPVDMTYNLSVAGDHGGHDGHGGH